MCRSSAICFTVLKKIVQAGDVVLSTPEVRQVTLPVTGGRVIIASDGLWDAVAAKTAAHHIRGIPASKAARELGQVICQCPSFRKLSHTAVNFCWNIL